MIHFHPFRGYRPNRDKVHLVASRSYVTYSKGQLQDKLDNNPYSFLHIIHTSSAAKLKGVKRYEEVGKAFRIFHDRGIFVREDQDTFYLYEQIIDGKSYRGWIGIVSTKDYETGKIKVHENTLTEREEMFRQYLEVTGFNAEPVLLAHKDDVYLNDLANNIARERPEYEFTSTDRITHKVWVVHGGSNLQYISDILANHHHLYIADGHHRMASSALLGRGKPDNDPRAGCMAFILPYSQLSGKAFYRLVKMPSVESITDFSNILKSYKLQYSTVENPENFDLKDGVLAFDANGNTIHVTWPEDNGNILERLPTSQLFRYILRPIGKIENDRNDKRLAYEPATQSVHSICKIMQKKKYQIGFLPPAISFETVMKIADARLTMPPKSTYVEPKLRSGLIVYGLEKPKR
jgi:uncharacterized protein (DUF1015 family)